MQREGLPMGAHSTAQHRGNGVREAVGEALPVPLPHQSQRRDEERQPYLVVLDPAGTRQNEQNIKSREEADADAAPTALARRHWPGGQRLTSYQ